MERISLSVLVRQVVPNGLAVAAVAAKLAMDSCAAEVGKPLAEAARRLNERLR